MLYSKTRLNQTSLGPAVVFRIEKCSAYTAYINKEILH